MALTRLLVETEERELEGVIMAKEKAQQKYDDALAGGKAAYKVEYDKDAQDLLTMDIGNLLPQKKITVKLTLLQSLDVFDKSWMLSLSPTLTPSFTNHAIGGGNQKQPQQLEKGAVFEWEVSVQITAHAPITRLVSLNHELTTHYGEGNRSVLCSVKGEGEAGPEFMLLFRSADISEPHIYLQESETHSSEMAALISFFPDFCPLEDNVPTSGGEEKKEKEVDSSKDKLYANEEEEEALEGAGEFIFVVDRSGSMSGSSIRMAVKAAKLFIKSLPQASRFNVVSFGSGYETMFSQSVAYTKENIKSALSHLDQFDANMGGTEIYQPLQQIYSWKKDPAYPVNIFLITDGEVDSPQQVIQIIKKNARSARCHSFGIGSGVSRELVKGAAIAGKGTYQFVEDSTDNMNTKVILSLTKAVRPALVDLSLQWPRSPLLEGAHSSVFHGEKCVLRAVLPKEGGAGESVLRCIDTASQEKKEFKLKLEEAVHLPAGEELFQLCARSALLKMEMEGEKEKMESVSLKYKVVSSETALLAVEKLKTDVEGEVKPFIISGNAFEELKDEIG